jgi:hypothetical protein
VTSEQIRRRGDVYEEVDLVGLQPGIIQGGAGSPQDKVAVIKAPVGPGALAPTTELVVKPAFVDGQMSYHPLGFEQPPVGPGWAEIAENLFVGDPVLGQERPRAEHGHPHARRRGNQSVHVSPLAEGPGHLAGGPDRTFSLIQGPTEGSVKRQKSRLHGGGPSAPRWSVDRKKRLVRRQGRGPKSRVVFGTSDSVGPTRSAFTMDRTRGVIALRGNSDQTQASWPPER